MLNSQNKIEQFITSGILELYCLGLLSPQERTEVESLTTQHTQLKEELLRVDETLNAIAMAESINPPVNMRNKVILAIEAAELGLPPLLSQLSTVNEWEQYLKENSIGPPPGSRDPLWVDLPSSANVISYAAWAPKGMAIEEEHEDEEERLLMLKGACNITANGITTTYHEGDLITIPPLTWHKAESCSDDLMVLIGQRVKV